MAVPGEGKESESLMDPHFCTGCGQPHETSGESEAVRIAKINADRDIKVEQIRRSELRHEDETAIEQTEINAEATVEEAVVTAAVLEELIAPDPAPEPGPVELPVDMPEPDPEPDTVPEPPETGSAPPESKGDGGWWGGYR